MSDTSPQTFDAAQARQFFDALVARANSIVGKFVMASFSDDMPPDIRHITNDQHAAPTMTDIAAGWTRDGKNVYVALALMRLDLPDGKKGTEADIVALLGFACDFDAKHDPSTYGTRLPVDPSAVVETSAGNFQAFIFLETAVMPADAKPVLVALVKSAGCDPTSADLSHVFRVPGTLNIPGRKKIAQGRPPTPQPVKLKSCVDSWEERPTLEQIRETCSSGVPAEAAPPSEPRPSPHNVEALLYAEGVDRSAKFARFVWECKRRGASLEETIALASRNMDSPVMGHFEGSTERVEKDVKRLWEKAAGGADPVSQAEIERLAGLSRFEYERERGPAAERLGVRKGALDSLVQEARGQNHETALQGRSFELNDPEPWHEWVDGDALLTELVATIGRYIVMDEAMAISVALWVMASYLFDCFTVFPRLAIVSPEKQCGKTTLLDVLALMARRALIAAHITPAVLFRIVEKDCPTLMLDEGDRYLHENQELLGILNSGHRRGGGVPRCVGDDHEPRMFSTWSPAVFAAIGRVPETLEDRSVVIRLRRRLPSERIEQFRADRTETLHTLAQKIARWAKDNSPLIDLVDPGEIEGLYNRVGDNWRPLITVADMAGSEWAERARKAARICVETNKLGDDQSNSVMLLKDIRAVFEFTNDTALPTTTIVGYLEKMEDRPWADFARGKTITPTQIARLLKPFDISPKTIRFGVGEADTAKGYKLEWFSDAFERYLSK